MGSQVVLIHKVSYLLGEKSYCLVHLEEIQSGEMAEKESYQISIFLNNDL